MPVGQKKNLPGASCCCCCCYAGRTVCHCCCCLVCVASCCHVGSWNQRAACCCDRYCVAQYCCCCWLDLYWCMWCQLATPAAQTPRCGAAPSCCWWPRHMSCNCRCCQQLLSVPAHVAVLPHGCCCKAERLSCWDQPWPAHDSRSAQGQTTRKLSKWDHKHSHAMLRTRQQEQDPHLYSLQFQAVVLACSTCSSTCRSKHREVSKQAGSSEGWCPCAEPGLFVDTQHAQTINGSTVVQ